MVAGEQRNSWHTVVPWLVSRAEAIVWWEEIIAQTHREEAIVQIHGEEATTQTHEEEVAAQMHEEKTIGTRLSQLIRWEEVVHGDGEHKL